jgi:hypothetical protein
MDEVEQKTKLWIREVILQGPILSITGDALVRHGVQKESTKLQLTSVFFVFQRGKISPDFDLERQNIPRFRLGKVALHFYA